MSKQVTIPDQPTRIPFELSISVHCRNADNPGHSEVSILLTGLSELKRNIKDGRYHPHGTATEIEDFMFTIDEVEDILIKDSFDWLSDCAKLLHTLKHYPNRAGGQDEQPGE